MTGCFYALDLRIDARMIGNVTISHGQSIVDIRVISQ